jgi:hypothetical protein
VAKKIDPMSRGKAASRTGDGRTRSRGPIKGSEVTFQSAGGKATGTGGFLGSLLRTIGGGKHRKGGSK